MRDIVQELLVECRAAGLEPGHVSVGSVDDPGSWRIEVPPGRESVAVAAIAAVSLRPGPLPSAQMDRVEELVTRAVLALPTLWPQLSALSKADEAKLAAELKKPARK